MEPAILALDMGGTNVKGGLFGSDARPLSPPSQISIHSTGSREDILAVLGCFIRTLAGKAAIQRVCISTPGPFRYEEGISEMAHKYQAIRGISLGKALREYGDLAWNTPIEFLSDANAYLIGESLYGAARGCDNCAAVTLGTGLGYSIMEGGALLVNSAGRPFDLLCFAPFGNGVLEDLVSGTGVARTYEQRTGQKTTAQEMAQRKDPISLAIFQEMAWALGDALRPRVARHHIRRLIVGGQMALAMPLFEMALRAKLPATEFFQAQNVDSAALYGAAAHALRLENAWKIVPSSACAYEQRGVANHPADS